jgi:hypothetical protein
MQAAEDYLQAILSELFDLNDFEQLTRKRLIRVSSETDCGHSGSLDSQAFLTFRLNRWTRNSVSGSSVLQPRQFADRSKNGSRTATRSRTQR